MSNNLEITIRAPALWRIINYIFNNIDENTKKMYNNFKEYLNINLTYIPTEFPSNNMIIMNDIIVIILKSYIVCSNLHSSLDLIFNDKIFNLIMTSDYSTDIEFLRVQELKILNNKFYEILDKIKNFRENNKLNIKLKTYSKIVEIFNLDFSYDSKYLLFSVEL